MVAHLLLCCGELWQGREEPVRGVVVVIPALLVGWPGRGRGCSKEAHLLMCCGEPWRRWEEPVLVEVVTPVVVVGWPGRGR